MQILSRKFFILFSGFFIIDALSALAYFIPPLRTPLYIIVTGIIAVVAVTHLSYGLYFLFAELFVGSKGYLLFLTKTNAWPPVPQDAVISLRITLFIIVGIIFFAHAVISFKKKKFYGEIAQGTVKNKLFKLYLIFACSILLGIGIAFARGVSLRTIFADANAYFFFAALVPAITFLTARDIKNVLHILCAGATWLSIKTVGLFAFFVYASGNPFADKIYFWVRNTVGEITPLGENAFRVFIQSQLYIVIALLMLVVLAREQRGGLKISFATAMLGSLFATALIMSMSRSFWVGGLTALGFLFCIEIINKRFRELGRHCLRLITIVLGTVIMLVALYAPVFSKIGLRASSFHEPGVSARAAQFRPLLNEIIKRPFFGSGFGSVVTYHSIDPRILKNNPTGLYTTDAFELGYLDIALKIGLVGLGIYLLLLGKIARGLSRMDDSISRGFLLGLIALAATHAFSPYLNHPLGIGYVILITVWLSVRGGDNKDAESGV